MKAAAASKAVAGFGLAKATCKARANYLKPKEIPVRATPKSF
jgi:hypothetical protein